MSQYNGQDLEIIQATENYWKARMERLKLERSNTQKSHGFTPMTSEPNTFQTTASHDDMLSSSLYQEATNISHTISSHGEELGFCSDQQATTLQLSEYIDALKFKPPHELVAPDADTSKWNDGTDYGIELGCSNLFDLNRYLDGTFDFNSASANVFEPDRIQMEGPWVIGDAPTENDAPTVTQQNVAQLLSSSLLDTPMSKPAGQPQDTPHGYEEFWTLIQPPRAGPVRLPEPTEVSRKRSRKENETPGTYAFNSQSLAKKPRRSQNREEREGIKLLKSKGACLLCRLLKVKCDPNQVCMPCCVRFRSGWTVFNGTKLGQCLRSFADANPFSAMRVDIDRINNEYLRYRIRTFLQELPLIWNALRPEQMIQASTHSIVSESPVFESWRIVDDILRGIRKNRRLVKVALAIAEMLLSLVFEITLACHESNAGIAAGQDSIDFTVHHISTFHKTIMAVAHRDIRLGVQAIRVLLADSALGHKLSSTLKSITWMCAQDFIMIQGLARCSLRDCSTTLVAYLFGYPSHAYAVSITAQTGELITLKFNMPQVSWFEGWKGTWEGTWRIMDLCRARYFCGKTMLHFMCGAKSSASDVKRLIEEGMDACAKDEMGRTPLDELCQSGKHKHIAALMERGLRLGPRHLMLACRGWHHDVVRLLLGAGVSPDREDDRGWTPLRVTINSCVRDMRTWHGQRADVIRELLDRSNDEQAKACCRQLLSYPPDTSMEKNWTQWLPDWAFTLNSNDDILRKRKARWRALVKRPFQSRRYWLYRYGKAWESGKIRD